MSSSLSVMVIRIGAVTPSNFIRRHVTTTSLPLSATTIHTNTNNIRHITVGIITLDYHIGPSIGTSIINNGLLTLAGLIGCYWVIYHYHVGRGHRMNTGQDIGQYRH